MATVRAYNRATNISSLTPKSMSISFTFCDIEGVTTIASSWRVCETIVTFSFARTEVYVYPNINIKTVAIFYPLQIYPRIILPALLHSSELSREVFVIILLLRLIGACDLSL